MNHEPLASTPSCGYNTVSARWRALFGKAARKIPLDAGFTCPNRDGTLSFGGCSFCNEKGSGTGLNGAMTLSQQWEHWRKLRQAKWGDVALIAYLQAFSNTHCPAPILERILGELACLPSLSGLCLGTRPDCLDAEKLGLLADFPTSELWLELGLQSSNPATLARVNRGHGPECFAKTVEDAAARGIKVLAHVVAGLPGEGPSDWSATVDFVNRLPVSGIKFHNLFVADSTLLAEQFRKGTFSPPGLEEYVDWVADSLARLRPDIIVHRISSDPAPGELVAPDWAADKRRVVDAIADALSRSNIRQGMYWP